MMLSKTILLVPVMAMVSVPVLAQEKPFDGLYLGGEIGRSDFDLELEPGDEAVSFDDSGMIYGGVIGARSQFDSGLVLGVEGRIAEPDFNLSLTDGADVVSLEPRMQYGIDGVVGFVPGVMPNTLFFGKAGYTRARSRMTFPGGETETDGTDAFRWGGGIEQSLSQNISLRAQAVRTNYDTVDNIDLKDWQVTAGLLFKF